MLMNICFGFTMLIASFNLIDCRLRIAEIARPRGGYALEKKE